MSQTKKVGTQSDFSQILAKVKTSLCWIFIMCWVLKQTKKDCGPSGLFTHSSNKCQSGTLSERVYCLERTVWLLLLPFNHVREHMWPVKQGWVRTTEKYQTENSPGPQRGTTLSANQHVGTCERSTKGKMRRFLQDVLKSWQICGEPFVLTRFYRVTQLVFSKEIYRIIRVIQ